MSSQKPRAYYILARYEEYPDSKTGGVYGTWCMEFGDYCRNTVKEEMEDLRDRDIRLKDMKILRLATDTNSAINGAISKLNMQHAANGRAWRP